MTSTKHSHTQGPVFWFANKETRQVHLATKDRGMVFVMGFARAGLQGGQPMFQVHAEGCDGGCRGCGVMRPLFEITGDPDHNGRVEVDHPDAVRLIDCWNALVGMNPKAIGDLVEAAKVRALYGHEATCPEAGEEEGESAEMCECGYADLRASLARLVSDISDARAPREAT